MGCDIHLHIEFKLRGEWEHYGAPHISRDYQLFEKMAGVRGDVKKAIAPPRGLPVDCSTVTRFDADRCGTDGHDCSWLGVEEIGVLSRWWVAQRAAEAGHPHFELGCLGTYFFGNSFEGRAGWPPGVEDVRFVFWFDS